MRFSHIEGGSCYVPLSKDYPEERINYITQTIESPFILDETIEVTSNDESNPDIDVSLNDLAYIILHLVQQENLKG